MNFQEFEHKLNITGKTLSITRKNDVEPYCPIKSGCTISVLNNAMAGETIRLSEGVLSCPGAGRGFGFSDAPMEIPGGFGHFASYGAGEGFPPGLRLMRDPELAEQSASAQPKGVMKGFSIIEIKPFEESDSPDLVTVMANSSQLSALNLLFHFRRLGDDLTIFPTGSGCFSLFRLPFSRLDSNNPRAIIGNADISSRPHFGADTLFFTVPGTVFREMLSDADESFLATSSWEKIRQKM